MANASARRSFHGPFQTPRPLPRRPPDPGPARPLDLIVPAAVAGSFGGAVLHAARAEAPAVRRDHVLASVLSALRRLTTAQR
jgi:hypothetical protein